MICILDIFYESYNQLMAIFNYICFAALVVLIAYLFITTAMGQIWAKPYKGYSITAIVSIITLLGLHFSLEAFGISLLVPPNQTYYFVEFMHFIQYIASISVVIIGTILFLAVVIGKFDGAYNKVAMSALVALILLGIIHWYVEDTFGVLIIFPPTLW